MSLDDIVEIYETWKIDIVNELLANGWKLINTYTTADEVIRNDLTMNYVLGRPADIAYHHESPYANIDVKLVDTDDD